MEHKMITMGKLSLLLASGAFLFFGTPASAQNAKPPETSDTCAKMASLALPNASVTVAKAYAAGTFVGQPQGFTGTDVGGFYKSVPAFGQVTMQAKPTADSNITIEVWMPAA